MDTQALQLDVNEPNSSLHLCPPYTSQQRENYRRKGLPLYRASLRGDVEQAKKVIDDDKSVVGVSITEGGETALHIAAAGKHVHLVEELLANMEREHLRIGNRMGNTALCFAAASKRNVQIAELIIDKNDNVLPSNPGTDGVQPLYIAAMLGHGDMVEYLYDFSKVEEWPDVERAELLTTCIASSLFDTAYRMIKGDPKLVVVQNRNNETALDVLALMPDAFAGGNGSPWRRFINSFPGMKQVHDGSLSQIRAFELLKCILDCVLDEEYLQISSLITKNPQLLFNAIKMGNIEFLTMLIYYFPDLIWTVDSCNGSIFHAAILCRHHSIFNLIYELESTWIVTTRRDGNNNNMLHLAAILPPPNQLSAVSGAALQMQREILWFKEVEKLVHYSYRTLQNNEDKTPQDIFSVEHAPLREKGEKWMKNTATSSMLVATIIASVMFTSIFTVPGGINDKSGVPNMLNYAFLKVFYISEAIAMFSSSTSILMFLSILTSRYEEMDFLHSLPFKLMIGVTTLLVSLAAMTIAFCSTIFLIYDPNMLCILSFFGLFSCVPIIFVSLKFPLLVDIIRSTYLSRFLFRSENRLFH